MKTVIEARKIFKEYPGIRAVNGVSFAVVEGTCFGLLGPNGAGKTTTVEILEGILLPTSGQVLYRDQPLGRRFREEAGIQFQSTALQDFLTVGETLRLFEGLYSRRSDLSDLIQQTALSDLLQQDVRKLSGGQRQRLLLAIALINEPAVVFLDEPTTGLDPQARRNFWNLIGQVKANNTTVILTTHYMEEAYVLCDDIAIMDHGQIIARGSPRDLLEAHFDDVILQLPKEDWSLTADDINFNVLSSGDTVEISTRDVNGAVKVLLEHGVSLDQLRIRPRTLEDLFLELTGRELRQ